MRKSLLKSTDLALYYTENVDLVISKLHVFMHY